MADRTRNAVAAVLAALALASCSGGGDGGGEDRVDEVPAPRNAPNIVVVMTDDQDFPTMSALPSVRRAIGDEGVTFDQSFVSYPLCCPSRATFFTGQLAHNNGVLGNKPDSDGGGYENLADPERVLPNWLRANGYASTHIGKFVHAYEGGGPPPGWDRFWGFESEQGHHYDYTLQGPGRQPTDYGTEDRDYVTGVLTRIATRQIDRLAPEPEPFFLSLAYTAPHVDDGRPEDAASPCAKTADGSEFAQPAPRDLDDVGTLRTPPQSGAFDERDVSDKPKSIRKRGRLSAADLDLVETRRDCQLASLRGVDRGFGQVMDALESSGELDDTVVVFTSDNGLFYGEHRLPGDKNRAYEEAIRVPLLIRGPGIPKGKDVTDPVLNTDLAPTILDLAGVSQPEEIARPQDGTSLVPLMRGERDLADRALLIEGRAGGTKSRSGGFKVASYQAVRTQRYVYVEYYEQRVGSIEDGLDVTPGTGKLRFTELYDLERDPEELENVAASPVYSDAETVLRKTLADLSECEGDECFVQTAVPGPE